MNTTIDTRTRRLARIYMNKMFPGQTELISRHRGIDCLQDQIVFIATSDRFKLALSCAELRRAIIIEIKPFMNKLLKFIPK